ncbi:uncharacterized protein Bfra_001916 [Botrytis fragariae]|uniref:Uncharacterized protein n=1 Tax=Botrytis fragariae TaxID=1964551 RepID=A0A8H6B1M0_9HELO|nr:uncharacterized protein Bfra_001916 [Botrytis fragariae]KAF5877549.1 hypothetical protein Bfra_001916 [Botrytis fragariae]
MNWLSPDDSSSRPLDPLRTIIHKCFRLAYLIHPNGIAQIPQRSTTARKISSRLAWYAANAMIELRDFGAETWKMMKSTLAIYLGTFDGEMEASPNSSNMTLCKADIHEKIYSSSSVEWPGVSF